MKRIRKEAWPLLVATVFLTFLWCWVYSRFEPSNWNYPPLYENDAALHLSLIQAAAEGGCNPFWKNSAVRLGAPFEADWNDYPMYDKILTWILGQGARAIGLMPVVNLAVLFAHLSSFWAFYLCSRWLRHRREWALAGGILFACSPYIFWRGMGHLFLGYAFTIPLMLLSCWLVGGRARMTRTRRNWCCAGALWFGASNPYFLNLYVQLMLWAIVWQWATRRKRANLAAGALCLACSAIAFISVNLGTFVHRAQHGRNQQALHRIYADTELFALKPMEFFIPAPNHNLGFLADIGERYGSTLKLEGETFSAYLGWIGAAAFIWLLAASLRSIARRSRHPVPAPALQAAWILMYATVGGLNNLIAFAGFPLFRATNRYSIFISGLIFFFLAGRLSRWSRGRSQKTIWILAAGAIVLGLVDQLPRPATREQQRQIAATVENDRSLARDLEAALPTGAMIYQLPIMAFPENGPIENMRDYEHLRPYFFSHDLRFSYGTNKGRPRENWQHAVAEMAPKRMAEQLEDYGFSAILVNRKGYPDRARVLVDNFIELGKTNIIEDGFHEQTCILLTPSASPTQPAEDEFPQVEWPEGRGWSRWEQTPGNTRRWTDGNAVMTFQNPDNDPTAYTLRCRIESLSVRTVEIRFQGRSIWKARLRAGQGVPATLFLKAVPGTNEIDFITDSPPHRNPVDPGEMIAFSVTNPEIRKTR